MTFIHIEPLDHLSNYKQKSKSNAKFRLWGILIVDCWIPVRTPCSCSQHVHSAYCCTSSTFCPFFFLYTYVFFYFLKIFLGDTCPFMGLLIPLFWTSGDVSSGFQSQSGFCLIQACRRCMCYICSERFTSGATPANLLQSVWQPSCSLPHTCKQVLVGLKTWIYRRSTDWAMRARLLFLYLSFMLSIEWNRVSLCNSGF